MNTATFSDENASFGTSGHNEQVNDLTCPWFPPNVIQAFHELRRVRIADSPARMEYLLYTYRRRFPAYSAFFLDELGHLYKRRQDPEKALNLLLEADALFHHENLTTLVSLVDVELDLTLWDEALAHVDEALQRFSEKPELLERKALALMRLGRYAEALALLEKSAQDDENVNVSLRLASCLFELGRREEAMLTYQTAQKLAPANEAIWQQTILMAHYLPQEDAESLRARHEEWRERFCLPLPPTDPALLAREMDPAKKLRIGLISPGFNMHPVGWMAGHSLWFLSLCEDVDLYFYSLSPGLNQRDPIRDRCQAAAAFWRDVAGKDEGSMYAQLLEDRLDILVDLAGHGEGSVLSLLSRRVAPVQVKWVGGLFNTTGAPNMDYLLSDRFETPQGLDSYYTEKLVRLPYSYVSYEMTDCGDTERIPDKEGEDGPIRFASFNNLFKFNKSIAEVWAEILKAVPESSLLLKTHTLECEEVRAWVRAMFAKLGIAAERLEFEGPSSYKSLMRSYRKVDLALDTWPYTGGVTTLEAIWMGVPVVTTAGPSFAGRHALSHLSNLGLESLVAKDFADYIRIAVTLASDRALLSDLRILLPYTLAKSPLVRHDQLAADLHTVFRAMWTRHCEGLPPIAMRFEQPSPLPEAFKGISNIQTDL